ncbi:MAG: hypothetical protein WC389_14525 [Lutibacter sp.]|jgi:hypothetical protein
MKNIFLFSYNQPRGSVYLQNQNEDIMKTIKNKSLPTVPHHENFGAGSFMSPVDKPKGGAFLSWI